MTAKVAGLLLGGILAAGLGACGSCNDSESDATPAPQFRTLPMPERWTLGVVAGAGNAVLPPGCHRRAETLRAVVSRPVSLAIDSGSLANLLVAEGSNVPEFKEDAAALMEFNISQHTQSLPIPWPARASRGTGGWLTAATIDGNVVMRRSERADVVAEGRAVDVKCHGLCSLLAQNGATITVWRGAFDAPIEAWSQATIQGRDDSWNAFAVVPWTETKRVLVAIEHDGQLDLMATSGGKAEAVAHFRAPFGALDVGWAPHGSVPMGLALARTSPRDTCAPEDGGVALEAVGQPTLHLRSGAPASSAALRVLDEGALVVWRARRRCKAMGHLVYASYLDRNRVPFGPITTVSEADQFVVSSVGNDVDLWLGEGRNVTWIRATCSTQGDAPNRPPL